METVTDKSFLRQHFRQIRDDVKCPEKDAEICRLLTESLYYKNADIIYTYYSVNYETDTRAIIDIALKDGKKIAIPKCESNGREMSFYFIENTNDQLTDGKFSLKEPDTDVCKKAYFTDKSICVVPGVAFDKKGCRLGYGGGYYDRFLVNFNGRSVGICFDECLCDELPCEPHDISVDIIITDRKIIELR